MHIQGTAIRRGPGARASDAAHINADPHQVLHMALGQKTGKHLLQALLVNLSVFQTLVQARPAALKMRRERQFWERLGSIFGDQRVHRIKQGIFGLPKAAIDLLTELLQYVKVHLEYAPLGLCLMEHYSIRRSSARGDCLSLL